jgi:hypothetical protein
MLVYENNFDEIFFFGDKKMDINYESLNIVFFEKNYFLPLYPFPTQTPNR